MGLWEETDRQLTSCSVCLKHKLTLYECETLTGGVSGEDGVCGRAGESRSSGIDGVDSKQVLGALNESAHHERLAQAHGTDGVTGDTCPALACRLLSLQPVASDWGATVLFRLLPVDGHGVHGDVGDCWLITLTGDSCKRTNGEDQSLEGSNICLVSTV